MLGSGRTTLAADGVVAIGMSAGGLQALREIAVRLPLDLGAGVIIAHHSGPSSILPMLLSTWSGRAVEFACAGEPLERNRVYVCPPGNHVVIEPDETITLSTRERIEAVRPSIDWLFTSVAASFADRAIGVVLSGANADGARGLREIVKAGGRAIVQELATCEYAAMPEAALASCPSAAIAPPQKLAAAIVHAVGKIDTARRSKPLSAVW